MNSTTSSYSAIRGASLPLHCVPQNDFLTNVSSVTGICMPTWLALISTLFGSFSIVAWLFAQLPQIAKNYKLRSTLGLSPLFLIEWLIGDASNLVGGLLTGQATWQVVLASYYVLADIAMVVQWFYYERLGYGNPMMRGWLQDADRGERDGPQDRFNDSDDSESSSPSASSSQGRASSETAGSDYQYQQEQHHQCSGCKRGRTGATVAGQSDFRPTEPAPLSVVSSSAVVPNTQSTLPSFQNSGDSPRCPVSPACEGSKNQALSSPTGVFCGHENDEDDGEDEDKPLLLPTTSIRAKGTTLPAAATLPASCAACYDPSYGTIVPPRQNMTRQAGRRQPLSFNPLTSQTAMLVPLLLCLASGGLSWPISPAESSFASSPPLTDVGTGPASPMSSSSAVKLWGIIISYTSTLFYLGSRLPQLWRNYSRKSTSGLSLGLFGAAFCGNLFYSSSLLTNPCAWYSFGPYGAPAAHVLDQNSFSSHSPTSAPGWVGPEGTDLATWRRQALPFFAGAAGVLTMDALIGFQFWYYSLRGANVASSGRHKGQTPVPVVAIRDSDDSDLEESLHSSSGQTGRFVICSTCQRYEWAGPGKPPTPVGGSLKAGRSIPVGNATNHPVGQLVAVSPLGKRAKSVDLRRHIHDKNMARQHSALGQEQRGPAGVNNLLDQDVDPADGDYFTGETTLDRTGGESTSYDGGDDDAALSPGVRYRIVDVKGFLRGFVPSVQLPRSMGSSSSGLFQWGRWWNGKTGGTESEPSALSSPDDVQQSLLGQRYWDGNPENEDGDEDGNLFDLTLNPERAEGQ